MDMSTFRILPALFLVLLAGTVSGCGMNNYLLSKQDLTRVTDRLSAVEKQLELGKTETELLLEHIQSQERLLQQTSEETASALASLEDQIRENHVQTDTKLTSLHNSLQAEPQSTPGRQQPTLESIGTDKLVVGRLEKVRLTPPGRVFHARIDTGATTSSLDAREIQVFERDGKRWVRFQIQAPNEETLYKVEKPVVRRVRIIQASKDEADRRPVVELQFQIGRIKMLEEFTLEDRSHMDYQVLIGRNILRDLMVVDVAKEFLAPLPKETSSGKDNS
jgi:hypothetical protein